MQATEVHGIRVELPPHEFKSARTHEERERLREQGINASARTEHNWGGDIIIHANCENLNALAAWLTECAVAFGAAADLINRRAAAVV